jgi:hypothetical protein
MELAGQIFCCHAAMALRTLWACLKSVEPAKGIEPPTYGLRNRCSTD